ncbi:MAG: hypothetical protein QOH64_2787 [Acidimicrobiaceae bacterium]|jgi:hypothetical protein
MTAVAVDIERRQVTLEQRRQIADDLAALRGTYGPRWIHVPTGYTTSALKARSMLATGVVPVDPDQADPVRLPQELGPFANETRDAAASLLDEVSYLGEALGTDLSGLVLRDLQRLARAILQLSAAPPPNPAWATPTNAHAAAVVLSTLGQDVRAASALHTELYLQFTEEVWELESVQRLPTKPWRRPLQRQRLRADLASVTRSGRPVADLKAALVKLRHTVQLRAKIDASWMTLNSHLGWFAAAGIPDVDGAADSLAALQRLQAILGPRLDPARLYDLGAADAFISDELTVPAQAALSTIETWEARAKVFSAVDPMSSTAVELAQWAVDIAESLGVVLALKDATASLRSSVRTVGQLLDEAILRDRIERLCGLDGSDGDTTAAATA